MPPYEFVLTLVALGVILGLFAASERFPGGDPFAAYLYTANFAAAVAIIGGVMLNILDIR